MLLFALKQFLDRWIAASFARKWSPELYWSPIGVPIYSLGGEDRDFVFALAGVAIPFAALGVWLTARRLRTLGLPLWGSVLFFVPAVNLAFFAFLVVANENASSPQAAMLERRFAWWPTDDSMSLGLAAALSATVGAAAVGLAVFVAPAYGWGVFIGVPFAVAMMATLLHSSGGERSFGQCAAASAIAFGICGGLILSFAIEGGVCLVMCVPLAIPLGLLGVWIGRAIARPSTPLRHSVSALLVAATMAPLIAAGDGRGIVEPEIFPVVTTVEVNAPPDKVWKNVIEFPELKPPSEVMFRLGIAYPIRARIEGERVGGIRYCEFSTGPFVEPITKWEEGALLAFDVESSPAPLRELSPYDLHTPHLDGFLQSHRGQFRLTPLDGGRRTLLEGTTWYSHKLYPAGYWRLWSDAILHAIHRRVLDHIRDLSVR